MITYKSITTYRTTQKLKEGRRDVTKRYLRINYKFANTEELDHFIATLHRKYHLLHPRTVGSRNQRFKASSVSGPYKIWANIEKGYASTVTRLPDIYSETVLFEKYRK